MKSPVRFPSLLILCVLLFALFPLRTLWAYSSSNVPINDPAYYYLDKLIAYGLIKDAIYGQRPWSRYEFARLTAQAIKNKEEMCGEPDSEGLESAPCTFIDRTLTYLKSEFREELIDCGAIEGSKKTIRFHYLEDIRFDYTLLDSPFRVVPNNGALGRVNAVINPLVAYREGRHFVDGSTLGLETTHRARLSKYFSFYFRPRLEVLVANSGGSEINPLVQQLYGKFTFKNVEVEIGRDSIIWGQGANGGMLFSNNARPLDLIKLSNPSPSRLPWVFKHLGSWRYTFFVANLGPEREFPRSFLTGLKLSLKPVRYFEIGISQILVLGGQGAPGPLSAGNVIREFFGSRPGNINNINLSNRQMGFDMRFWFPFLRNSQLYLDVQFDDGEFGSPLFNFTDLASYYVGFYVPRLDFSGKKDLRLEYKHGSPFLYRNSTFITGMALNRRVFGDELGPQGDGLYITFSNMISPSLRVLASFQYERRDADTLSQTEDANSKNRRIFPVSTSPEEHRIRLQASVFWNIRNWLRLHPQIGFEYVENYNFIAGSNRNNFLGGFELIFDFENYLKSLKN